MSLCEVAGLSAATTPIIGATNYDTVALTKSCIGGLSTGVSMNILPLASLDHSAEFV